MSNFETFLEEIESIKSREEAYTKMRDNEFAEGLTHMFAIDDATAVKINERVSKEAMRAFVYYLPLSARFLRKMILRAGDEKEIVSLYKAATLESLVLMFDGLGEGEIDTSTVEALQKFQEDTKKFQLQKAQQEKEVKELMVQNERLESELSGLKKFAQEKEDIIRHLEEEKKMYAELRGQFTYYKEEKEAFEKKGNVKKVGPILEQVQKLLNSIKDQMSFDDKTAKILKED